MSTFSTKGWRHRHPKCGSQAYMICDILIGTTMVPSARYSFIYHDTAGVRRLRVAFFFFVIIVCGHLQVPLLARLSCLGFCKLLLQVAYQLLGFRQGRVLPLEQVPQGSRHMVGHRRHSPSLFAFLRAGSRDSRLFCSVERDEQSRLLDDEVALFGRHCWGFSPQVLRRDRRRVDLKGNLVVLTPERCHHAHRSDFLHGPWDAAF